MFDQLFTPARFGDLALKNRIVMAPMTRNRAEGGAANALMAEYYGARAGAGLIITEGVAPDANGMGYARMPGLYNDAQAASWRPVTEAVHARGGLIVAQLMHTGRMGHPANLPAEAWLEGPSRRAAAGEIHTDHLGVQPMPEPRAMTSDDIARSIANFAAAARRAMQAGFDGVEVHGANGYIFEQFLHPVVNDRTDRYGGDVTGRSRLLLEATAAIAEAVGPGRVGVRLSPYGKLGDLPAYDEIPQTYGRLAEAFSDLGVAYLHLSDHGELPMELKQALRRGFDGAMILNGGYDAARAEEDVNSGLGDAIAFGRPFLANPDFPDRLRASAPLAEPDYARLYTPGPEGYTRFSLAAA